VNAPVKPQFGPFSDEPVKPMGRPSWCPGALLIDVQTGKDRGRQRCAAEIQVDARGVRYGLCIRCSDTERAQRAALASQETRPEASKVIKLKGREYGQ